MHDVRSVTGRIFTRERERMMFSTLDVRRFRRPPPLLAVLIACGMTLAGVHVANATTYYVDPAGSDSNDGISPSTPFRTITHAYGLTVAGDAINVAPGTYGKDDQTPDWGLHLNHNGTATKPITLTSTVRLGAVIDGENYSNRVVGIHLDGNYNVLDGFEIKNGFNGGIYVAGSHNVITRNLIHDNGTTDPGNTSGQYGVFSHQSTNDNTYNTNDIHDNGRSGSNLDHGMYLCGDNELVTNNIVTGNAANGLQVAGYRTVSNMKIYNNVFAYNGSNGIILWQTIRGIGIKNNILYQNGHAGIGSWAARGGGVVVDHNLVYGNAQGDYDFTAGFSHYTYTLGTTVAADPLFFSSTDFHLQPGSPAIDAGLTLDDVPDDYDGNPRPNGAAYDIGAYEL
jgi:hypothetical protein